MDRYVANGMPRDRVLTMGLPHWGCTRKGINRLQTCCMCGGMASNAHHLVPKGMSGGSLAVWTDFGRALHSPLVAVCGMGNASGCHRLLHAHVGPMPKWVWYSDEMRLLHESGELWLDFASNDERLNEYGRWVLVDRNGR